MHPRTDIDAAEMVSTFDAIARRVCLAVLFLIFTTSAAAEFLVDRAFVVPAMSSLVAFVWWAYRSFTQLTPDEHAVSYDRREG